MSSNTVATFSPNTKSAIGWGSLKTSSFMIRSRLAHVNCAGSFSENLPHQDRQPLDDFLQFLPSHVARRYRNRMLPRVLYERRPDAVEMDYSEVSHCLP